MLLLFSSEAASTLTALVAVDMGILQLPLLRLPSGIEFPTNLEQMLHQVSFEQGCGYFQYTKKKSLWTFFLKNAVKLINSHDIVFLQSYVNFQEINLDGKLRGKNRKVMPLGFSPMFTSNSDTCCLK